MVTETDIPTITLREHERLISLIEELIVAIKGLQYKNVLKFDKKCPCQQRLLATK